MKSEKQGRHDLGQEAFHSVRIESLSSIIHGILVMLVSGLV